MTDPMSMLNGHGDQTCFDQIRKEEGQLYGQARQAAACKNPWECEPTSVEQAQRTKWWPQWEAACEREMENHRQLGTWELVPITQLNRTRGDVLLNTKMFGKCKRGPDGNLLPGNKGFKMRCVARGDQPPDWLCPCLLYTSPSPRDRG